MRLQDKSLRHFRRDCRFQVYNQSTPELDITRAELEEVVAISDLQRFSFDEPKIRIRANQGHSVEVDLQLEPLSPAKTLPKLTEVCNS